MTDRRSPRAEVNFQCAPCRRTWAAAPDRVEDDPEYTEHPYRYFAACTICGFERKQAPWERALFKAWVNATGPKTAEGKAATAANLVGHPTPEEAKRTRFNAMKNGLYAKTATYFPAKPDGYSFCSGCEVDRLWCGEQAACVKQTEKFMLHQAAFESRDPKKLMGIYSDLHAAIFAVIQAILQQIIADGVKFESVVWHKDEDGEIRVAEYIDETGTRRILKQSMEAHPLLRQLGELLSRTGLTLADMGMTQKVIEAEEQDLGRLAHEQETKEEMSAFRERSMKALENLADKVMRANDKTARDPILIEHMEQDGTRGGN